LEMRREDSMKSQIFESIPQHLARSLGSISVSPISHSEPVAKLGMPMLPLNAHANSANLVSVWAEGNCQPQLVRFLRQFKEVPCVLFRVGMRDAQRRRCNLARTDQG